MLLFETKGLEFASNISYPDLKIESGKTTFICGESGCGKSSLFKMLNKTALPSHGSIFYCGQNLLTLDALALRREILLVGQNAFLFPGTVMQNVADFYGYLGAVPPTEAEFAQYLSLCLADFNQQADCASMSGGERQRVFLAISLSLHPKALLLDEPTSALDEATATRLLGNLRTFCREESITPLVICHNPSLTDAFAERVITLQTRKQL